MRRPPSLFLHHTIFKFPLPYPLGFFSRFSRGPLFAFRLRGRYLAVLATFFSPLGRGLMWILGLNAKSPLSTFVVGASLDVVMLAIIIVVGAVSLDCCLLFM